MTAGPPIQRRARPSRPMLSLTLFVHGLRSPGYGQVSPLPFLFCPEWQDKGTLPRVLTWRMMPTDLRCCCRLCVVFLPQCGKAVSRMSLRWSKEVFLCYVFPVKFLCRPLVLCIWVPLQNPTRLVSGVTHQEFLRMVNAIRTVTALMILILDDIRHNAVYTEQEDGTPFSFLPFVRARTPSKQYQDNHGERRNFFRFSS